MVDFPMGNQRPQARQESHITRTNRLPKTLYKLIINNHNPDNLIINYYNPVFDLVI